ncbi:MAG TPA: hypothetical protein VNU70_02960 [Puia sp.]|jgi:hypothetical protein|nr:hypothetical protein [Puia sp.]
MKKSIMPCFVMPLLLASCATYHVSTQSLVQQMVDTKPEKKIIYAPTLPPIPFSVQGNDLRRIVCLDKNGKETSIEITNRTSVRITRNDSTHTTFYFNTLLIRDSTVTGSKTHFFEAHIRPIKLRDITKIEIQKS